MDKRLSPPGDQSNGRTFSVALRMPTELFQRLYRIALKEGRSTEQQVFLALEGWLSSREKDTDQS